jgi:hypothetical protein
MKAAFFMTGIISLMLIFGTAVTGCATTGSTASPDVSFDGTALSAEGTAEGIRLNFSNIPPETTNVVVMMKTDQDGQDYPLITLIRGSELDYVKNTGALHCPFVKSGEAYTIHAYLYTGELNGEEKLFESSAVAGGGIHLINNPSLQYDTANNIATVSAVPAFSGGVNYSENAYAFRTILYAGEFPSYSYMASYNNLAYDFSSIKREVKEQPDWNYTGDIRAYAVAYCNLNNENIKWTVAIAKSDEFILSF